MLADDTVAVLLNGNPLVPFGDLGNDSKCAQYAPGCLASTETSQVLTGLSLHASNTFEFIVEQAGTPPDLPTAILQELTSTPALPPPSPPEPGSLFLLGTGFLG